MICSDTHTHCHSCWCKLFEWIRIEWIRTGGIRVEDTYWWDMYWRDTFTIPADAYLLNGYVCNGYVLVGYVWKGYVWNGYVWDMYDVLDMYGICVVIGGIRITTFWKCWICAMCWICVGYVWWIRLEWICVGYVWCAGYVWDMCGVRYANNLLKNPATKRLSGIKHIRNVEMSFSTTNKRRKWTQTGHFIISDLISPRLILSYLLVSAPQQLTSHGSEDQHFANLSLVTVFMEYYLSAPQSFHTRPSFQASKIRNQNFIPWHHPNHFLELCQPIQALQPYNYLFISFLSRRQSSPPSWLPLAATVCCEFCACWSRKICGRMCTVLNGSIRLRIGATYIMENFSPSNTFNTSPSHRLKQHPP